MVKMKPLPDTARASDVLGLWPARDTMTTSEIIEITGKNHSVVYRWMMRLAIFGYFTRRSEPRRAGHGGGTIVFWTITPKGRSRH